MNAPLTNLTPEAVTDLFEQWGEGRQRAWHLNRAVFRLGLRDFSDINDLRRDLRRRLAQEFSLPSLNLHGHLLSDDGTEKFIFELPDGERVESIMIPGVSTKPGARALCVSSQAGCAFACGFCFTGLQGLTRNLEPWEITEQVREVNRRMPTPVSHVVFMGMGEPLSNYGAVRTAIATFISPQGFSIGQRKITVSTVGLLPTMRDLAEQTQVQIALSLHAPNDTLRATFMPAARQQRVEDLIAWMKGFPAREQTRFMVEYILLDGVNNLTEHAEQTARLLKGLRCKVNLIAYNAVPGLPYRRPSDASNEAFQAILRAEGLEVSIRRTRGADILGACGQLSGQQNQ